MRIIPIKTHRGKDDSRAVLKDGEVIYVCPVCDIETQDIFIVFYGRCHGDDTYKIKLN